MLNIKKIDNNFLNSQRHGWNNIIDAAQKTVKSHNNVIFIDYMDKYFNLWFDLSKNIYCTTNKKTYRVNIKDTLYYIGNNFNKLPYERRSNFECKNNDDDIFLCENKFYVKWFSEFNEFKIIKGALDYEFKKKYDIGPITTPWVGFIHYPVFPSTMNYSSDEELKNIVKSRTFIESKPYCKCIIALSEHSKQQVSQYITDIPIEVIYHPAASTDDKVEHFDKKKYIKNKDKSVLQIGYWLRKMDTIYKLDLKKIKFKKKWLPGGTYWKDMFKIMYKNSENMLEDKTVDIILDLNHKEYDTLLSENVVLLNVFEASANNTLLECMSRNTPIILNRHPAFEEYIGEKYPLFFDNEDEIASLVGDQRKHIIASNYIKLLPKKKIQFATFIDNLQVIINNVNNEINEEEKRNKRNRGAKQNSFSIDHRMSNFMRRISEKIDTK